jgi:hypothetical protein
LGAKGALVAPGFAHSPGPASPASARRRFLACKDDELDGRREEFQLDGTDASVGDRRASAMHGKWIERSADGRRRRNLECRAGLLHGELRRVQDDKRPTRQQWDDGQLSELDGRRPFPEPVEGGARRQTRRADARRTAVRAHFGARRMRTRSWPAHACCAWLDDPPFDAMPAAFAGHWCPVAPEHRTCT